MSVQYADISHIVDIEEKFYKGAQLAKQYVNDNNMANLNDGGIDRNLQKQLSALRKVGGIVLFRHLVFFLAVVILIIGFGELALRRFKRKKLWFCSVKLNFVTEIQFLSN